MNLNIGIVGFSSQNFDEQKAICLINKALDILEKSFSKFNKIIVSGLIDLAIPSLAYQEAVKRNYKTVGIACKKQMNINYFL